MTRKGPSEASMNMQSAQMERDYLAMQTDDDVVNDFIYRIERIAYALQQDGRTADGCTKAGAAINLVELATQIRLYFKASDR